jgi:hypothetical protein
MGGSTNTASPFGETRYSARPRSTAASHTTTHAAAHAPTHAPTHAAAHATAAHVLRLATDATGTKPSGTTTLRTHLSEHRNAGETGGKPER